MATGHTTHENVEAQITCRPPGSGPVLRYENLVYVGGAGAAGSAILQGLSVVGASLGNLQLISANITVREQETALGAASAEEIAHFVHHMQFSIPSVVCLPAPTNRLIDDVTDLPAGLSSAWRNAELTDEDLIWGPTVLDHDAANKVRAMMSSPRPPLPEPALPLSAT
jgi:hypothetical protein